MNGAYELLQYAIANPGTKSLLVGRRSKPALVSLVGEFDGDTYVLANGSEIKTDDLSSAGMYGVVADDPWQSPRERSRAERLWKWMTTWGVAR